MQKCSVLRPSPRSLHIPGYPQMSWLIPPGMLVQLYHPLHSHWGKRTHCWTYSPTRFSQFEKCFRDTTSSTGLLSFHNSPFSIISYLFIIGFLNLGINNFTTIKYWKTTIIIIYLVHSHSFSGQVFVSASSPLYQWSTHGSQPKSLLQHLVMITGGWIGILWQMLHLNASRRRRFSPIGMHVS